MSVSHQLHRSADTGYTGFTDGAVSADVVSDIRSRLPQPAAPAPALRQEVVADLLATRGDR